MWRPSFLLDLTDSTEQKAYPTERTAKRPPELLSSFFTRVLFGTQLSLMSFLLFDCEAMHSLGLWREPRFGFKLIPLANIASQQ
mmetsp:Transcript_24604/g.36125  ORF Transcript_24604/g.36125 Transcript_24604/m.36125 type:complete len:84 (-) Transcript_24604:786-1037(-)